MTERGLLTGKASKSWGISRDVELLEPSFIAWIQSTHGERGIQIYISADCIAAAIEYLDSIVSRISNDCSSRYIIDSNSKGKRAKLNSLSIPACQQFVVCFYKFTEAFRMILIRYKHSIYQMR